MKSLYFLLSICFTHILLANQPNIVWICIEDASPHIGCYGEKAIQTPNINQLAKNGVLFEKAFVSAPVCSTSRSAMITGMYQTTSGLLHHRSQSNKGKASGNEEYYDSYHLPKEIQTVPEIFKQHGYYVSNKTKTDYNFIRDNIYDSKSDWKGRKEGQPFFAQFQLIGGKSRKSTKGVDFEKIKLPPYYADTDVIKNDWAHYLGSWVRVDQELKGIVERLEKENLLDNTIIFFWTDHGVSHIRGKQFLYEEGIHIPLIIKHTKGGSTGVIRKDLVNHIDIPVTSLALAGISVPDYMQGKMIFGESYEKQDMIFTARDRCDETVDILRGVRTQKFKYIRNFLPFTSHMQRSQYKEGKKIVEHSKLLYSENKLNALQARPFQSTRPIEELYDLEKDPHETKNLAADPSFQKVKSDLKEHLYQWMINTKDMGLIPEPMLEDLGKQYGNKYYILQAKENANLVKDLLTFADQCDFQDRASIINNLDSNQAVFRYWSAKAIGNHKLKDQQKKLEKLLTDSHVSVRIAAAESLGHLGDVEKAVRVLKQEMAHPNVLAGLYAIRSLEAIGQISKEQSSTAVQASSKGPYEFTRRVAKRLIKEWGL